jgi:sugar lactone lactonase YvrE
MLARYFALSSFLAVAISLPVVAETGAYTASVGTFAAPTTVGQQISVIGAPLAGTKAKLWLWCTISAFATGTYQWKWTCSGGTIYISSTDGSLSTNGSGFNSASMTLTVSGGAGKTVYLYSFTGYFHSQVTQSGTTQAALGSISFSVKTAAPIGSSNAPITNLYIGWNSRYSPILAASTANPRLLMGDSLFGDNLVSYGTTGNGTGQFGTISGLAHDASGRIYVSDSTLDRLVRIDDMKGTNWVQLGSLGVGNLHFTSPAGVAIDSAGKIWVADAGNNRIVRFDDMTGTNWTSFGSAGNGASQFSNPSAIAFDAQGRIYVGDSGNGRLVRFDDLTGTNWTTLNTINIAPYAYSLSSINEVVVLPNGKIMASTQGGWLYRVDDMTGANAQAASWTAITGITSDPSGAVFVVGGFTPGLAQTLDAASSGYFSGTLGQKAFSATAVLAMATSVVPPPDPVVTVASMGFGNQNVGEPSATKQFAIFNYGAGSMAVSSMSASADYNVTNSCPASLVGEAGCYISVQFKPVATGPRPSPLTISTNGVHPLMNVSLTGTGTAPSGTLLPAALTFAAQQTSTSSASQTAVLTNTGTGPLTISSIGASGDFSVTHNCPAVVAAGNGCTLQVTFQPTATGTRSGAVNISDDNIPTGTTQSITLGGTGSSAAPLLTLTPQSILFPAQQVGVASAAQTFTVTNGSSSAVSLSAPSIPTGFTGTTTCGSSLAAGNKCTINLQFVPAAVGTVSGTVSVPVTGQASLTASVEGTGVSGSGRVLTVSPSALGFGGYQISENPSLSLTISNPKGYPVGIRSTSYTGDSAFAVTANNCPAILAGGASCTVTITFTPLAVTGYQGTWTLTEASGAITAISVSGSGLV